MISINRVDRTNALFLAESLLTMGQKALSIRPFIGSSDFNLSRNFYRDLGFEEVVLSLKMSLFKKDGLAFYLQDAFVQDWVNNTMIFMEVDDVVLFWEELIRLNLTARYKDARLVPPRVESWGRECFLHDPSGILWHFGEFFKER